MKSEGGAEGGAEGGPKGSAAPPNTLLKVTPASTAPPHTLLTVTRRAGPPVSISTLKVSKLRVKCLSVAQPTSTTCSAHGSGWWSETHNTPP